MSRLLVITRPEIVSGFNLAGVDAYAATDAASTRAQIERWLLAGEQGLLAVDEELFAQLTRPYQGHLQQNEQLLLLVIPSGRPVGAARTSRERITDLIREAVGFHITFQERT